MGCAPHHRPDMQQFCKPLSNQEQPDIGYLAREIAGKQCGTGFMYKLRRTTPAPETGSQGPFGQHTSAAASASPGGALSIAICISTVYLRVHLLRAPLLLLPGPATKPAAKAARVAAWGPQSWAPLPLPPSQQRLCLPVWRLTAAAACCPPGTPARAAGHIQCV